MDVVESAFENGLLGRAKREVSITRMNDLQQGAR